MINIHIAIIHWWASDDGESGWEFDTTCRKRVQGVRTPPAARVRACVCARARVCVYKGASLYVSDVRHTRTIHN